MQSKINMHESNYGDEASQKSIWCLGWFANTMGVGGDGTVAE